MVALGRVWTVALLPQSPLLDFTPTGEASVFFFTTVVKLVLFFVFIYCGGLVLGASFHLRREGCGLRAGD